MRRRATASLREAFARSCNTAFVELGIKTGSDALAEQAKAFGIGPGTPGIPIPVADSTIGSIPTTRHSVSPASASATSR